MKDLRKEKDYTPLLEVKDLYTHFFIDNGIIQAVDGVNFKVYPQETLGLIGESGCGKSVTAQSIMRIVPSPPGKIVRGSIIYKRGKEDGLIDISTLDPRGKQIRSLRGNEIAMIFQEPMTSFNPVLTVGDQIIEMVVLHQKVNKRIAKKRAIEMLAKVRFPNAEQRVNSYPHQLSGGLRQRAMIAMALSCSPSLLIADEPTTALDVTIQAQILELMKELQEEFRMSMIIITHDLGVINELADDVAVMYLGQIVEYSNLRRIFDSPKHPYTKALFRSIHLLGSKTKKRLDHIRGIVPNPINLSAGCRFFPRCKEEGRESWHEEKDPPYVEVEKNHWVRCWCYEN